MLARNGSPDFRRLFRDRGVAKAEASLDAARRARYAALLRRWILERIPGGADAAPTAADWTCALLSAEAGVACVREGSALVALRARLIADRSRELRARLDGCAAPSSRVEQLIGRDHLDAWDDALAVLPRRQRELVILRVEFGFDDSAIAQEMSTPLAVARAETVNALAALIDALGCGSRERAA